MKKYTMFLLFCLFASGLFGQNNQLTGKQIQNFTHPVLQSTFERSQVYQIAVEDLLKVASTAKRGFDLKLDLPGLPKMDVQLQPSGILADNYTTLIAEEGGVRTTTQSIAVYPFISKPNDAKTAQAALTIAPDFLYGLFKQDGQTWYIEPLWYFDNTQPHNLFVVYEDADVLQIPGNACGMLEAEHEMEQAHDRTTSAPPPACGPPELELAIANDYRMVVKYGSVNNVIVHNVGVMNDVQANWDDEFNKPVMIKIVTQFVPATQAADPFPPTTNHIDLIMFFRGWANGGGFGATTYDLAHLRASRTFNNGALGAAYFKALCGFDRYGVMSDISLPACGLRTVVSHEMGHTFGANHDTDIMNAFYTGCTNIWSQFSKDEINALLDFWPCLTPSPTCNMPINIPVPPDMAFICTGIEECVTLADNPCIATYSATTNDPNLQVTVNGNTICITSTLEATRVSYVSVIPLDYCGNPPAYDQGDFHAPWIIRIDNPTQCPQYKGDGADNRGTIDAQSGLTVFQHQDVLNVKDSDINHRNKDIRIFDMNGKLLLEQETSSEWHQISLSNMPTGMLVVKVNAGGQVVTKRIMKL